MDKYEYKIKSEEIRALIEKKEYAEAAAIADSIDWRRVKSVMMLCTISDLYKINRRFEDAKDMLLMAYDRYPGGRSIVYSLCEISIKLEEFVQAIEYYKEFVQIAPKDSGRYVLQYKLYEAQDVSLEERIAVLEELKAKDYIEKWAYELAYLYHRIGLATKCVEECDDLILWFGEGKYVLKALELKMLHEPINDKQKEKYAELKKSGKSDERLLEEGISNDSVEEVLYQDDAPTKEITPQDLDIQVKLMNVGQYDTINMQKELAQNMKDLWEGPTEEEIQKAEESQRSGQYHEATTVFPPVDVTSMEEEETNKDTKIEEVFFHENEEETEPDSTDELITEDNTSEIEQETKSENDVEINVEDNVENNADTASKVMEAIKYETQMDQSELSSVKTGDMKEWSIAEPPEQFKKILGMEYDGQISMVVPDSERVEKQITGQISLEEVLVEWERMKKENEQKRMEAVRQHVLEQTGAMFTEFDQATLREYNDEILEEPEESEEESNTAIKADQAEDYCDNQEYSKEETELEELEDEEDTEELEEVEETEELDEVEELEDLEEIDGAEETEEVDEVEESDEYEEVEELEEVEETKQFDDTDDKEKISESDELEDTIDTEGTEGHEELEETEEVAESDEYDDESYKETDENEVNDEYEDEIDEETEENEEDHSEDDEISLEERNKQRSEKAIERAKNSKINITRPIKQDKPFTRTMSPEERQMFGSLAFNKNTRAQIIQAIDNISLAPYTGNVIITGDEEEDTFNLAKKLLKEVQQADSNFTGKIAKVTPKALSSKGVSTVFDKLSNGAVIIQNAGSLNETLLHEIVSALEKETRGLILVLEDNKQAIHKLERTNDSIKKCFPLEINIEALDDAVLVEYAQKYAKDKEYSIDNLGILALHTKIAERQTSDHAVTISEVREIMDDAIHHANRKTPAHFFDILVAKRYDEEDMIILREKDFV